MPRRSKSENGSRALQPASQLALAYKAILDRRLLVTALVLMASVSLGWFISFNFGSGLRPSPPAVIDIEGGQMGVMEAIRMPLGARKKEDLSSFKIENNGADDYVKVFANNYLVLSDEDPGKLFYITAPEAESEQKRKKFLESVVDRREYRSGSVEIVAFLRRGSNYIIVENENSTLGACATAISMLANNVTLEGFPKTIPLRFSPESSVLNEALVTRYKEAGLSHLNNAMCARRIFTFYLD